MSDAIVGSLREKGMDGTSGERDEDTFLDWLRGSVTAHAINS